MANPPDALLTMDEQVAASRARKNFGGPLSDAICAAQHRKTLRWVADLLKREPSSLIGDNCKPLCHTHERWVFADELRALADGRGEG